MNGQAPRSTQESFIRGSSARYPFIYHFWQTRYPFRISYIAKWYHFHRPSLELSIPFNCDPTVFWIWINYITRTSTIPQQLSTSVGPFWPSYRQKWQIFLPFHVLQILISLPFHIPEDRWKKYSFREKPPGIDHYKEYLPGTKIALYFELVPSTYNCLA